MLIAPAVHGGAGLVGKDLYAEGKDDQVGLVLRDQFQQADDLTPWGQVIGANLVALRGAERRTRAVFTAGSCAQWPPGCSVTLLVVAGQAGALACRLSLDAGVSRGSVARYEWVAISSAACWASMSQGACPPGIS